jgi:hypothetical protein
MLTSCNNVKPLIIHPEEHYYENAHAPFEVEAKHNYLDSIDKPIALITLAVIVFGPFGLADYILNSDKQPKEEAL